MSFLQLPDEILVSILHHLSAKDCTQIGLTCRRLSHLTLQNEDLWCHFLFDDLPNLSKTTGVNCSLDQFLAGGAIFDQSNSLLHNVSPLGFRSTYKLFMNTISQAKESLRQEELKREREFAKRRCCMISTTFFLVLFPPLVCFALMFILVRSLIISFLIAIGFIL